MKLYKIRKEILKCFTDRDTLSRDVFTQVQWEDRGFALESLDEVKPKRVESVWEVSEVKLYDLCNNGSYIDATKEQLNFLELALNELGGSKAKINELAKEWMLWDHNPRGIDLTDWIEQTKTK